MQVQPYLFFDGICEQAMEFYRQALDAKIDMVMRFKDSPDPSSCAVPDVNKIMHAQFRIGDSLIMASDGRSLGKPNFDGFSLSLNTATVEEAKRLFDALSDGGKVQVPFGSTFWSAGFGMVADKFGMHWMVNAHPAEQQR